MNWMDDLNQARNHHQLGHFSEADAGYRRVLALPCCYQPQDSVFTIGTRPSRESF
jgi:hypothetical protein